MNFESLKYIYFIGIGGIGMSAIARYFAFIGKTVIGYDKTETTLTQQLHKEGIIISYIDDIRNIPDEIKLPENKDSVLVVYTPAIPQGHTELNYFRDNGFTVMKRAQVLGLISRNSKCIGIAGTHGKTSVTTMTAHLFKQSAIDCSAFLGGISKNYNTNFLFSSLSNYVVVEADEFDRFFHQLSPSTAVITAMDADHLDIYGTHQAILDSFYGYILKINNNGKLIYKKGLPIEQIEQQLSSRYIDMYSYAYNDTSADFYADDIKIQNAEFKFNIVTPFGTIDDIHFTVPGTVNIENAVAAVAVATIEGVTADEIKNALSTFAGVKRRFDYQLKSESVVYIDDYAHHPEELRASIMSIKAMFPGKKISGVFQPHLFSRTKDFAPEFSESLSLLDELFLMDIYPAREEPIPGVDSDMIFKNVTIENKYRCNKQNLIEKLNGKKFDILMTLGAGDIDTFIEPIKEMLKKQ